MRILLGIGALCFVGTLQAGDVPDSLFGEISDASQPEPKSLPDHETDSSPQGKSSEEIVASQAELNRCGRHLRSPDFGPLQIP